MKLSEFKDEKAMEALGELIEPVCAICSDKKVASLFKSGVPKLNLIGYILKEHPKEIMTCMAILDGEKPEDYHCDLLTLPKKLLEIFNDEDFMQLFSSAE